MKAIILHNKGSADNLKLEEAETPRINDDEVLVKVKAASVNHLDIWVRMGNVPRSYPIILGCEEAGDVSEAGKEGKLKPVIDREFQLKDASLAHKYMEERKNFGKIILKP